MQPLVDITEGTLDALGARPDALESFGDLLRPIAAARAKLRTGCSRCQEAARKAVAEAYRRAKEGIVALPPDRRAALKALLGAEKYRVVAGQNSQGTPVRHTF